MTPTDCGSHTPQGFPQSLAALRYAAQLHAGQRRQVDGAPFILHPLEVGVLLYRAGAPDHVIAAGLLHDAIEKTDATATDLRARFGLTIAGLVIAVSEDQRIDCYEQRKAALRKQVTTAGHEALTIFAADKVSKVRELRLDHAQTRVAAARDSRSRTRRLTHYRQCLRLLEEHLTDSPLVTQLRTQLEKPPLIASHPSAGDPTTLCDDRSQWAR